MGHSYLKWPNKISEVVLAVSDQIASLVVLHRVSGL